MAEEADQGSRDFAAVLAEDDGLLFSPGWSWFPLVSPAWCLLPLVGPGFHWLVLVAAHPLFPQQNRLKGPLAVVFQGSRML